MTNWCMNLVPTTRESTQSTQTATIYQLDYNLFAILGSGLTTLSPWSPMVMEKDDQLKFRFDFTGGPLQSAPDACTLQGVQSATLEIVSLEVLGSPFTQPIDEDSSHVVNGGVEWPPAAGGYYGLANPSLGYKCRLTVTVDPGMASQQIFSVDPEMVVGPGDGSGGPPEIIVAPAPSP